MLHQSIDESAAAGATLQELQKEWARLRALQSEAHYKADEFNMAMKRGERDHARAIDVLETREARLAPRIAALEVRMLAAPAVNLGDLVVLLDLAIGRCDLEMPDSVDFENGRGAAAVKFVRALLRLAPKGASLLHTRAEFADTWEAIEQAA